MPKTAVLFPGQGAQSVGMAHAAIEAHSGVADLFRRASAILGYDLHECCRNGPAAKLDSTAISQPAIFVSSLGALEILKATDPSAIESCVAAAGLSLGEYTALVFAGAIEFDDGVRLVHQRGTAMQSASDATPSGMVSVIGLDRSAVEDLVGAARTAGFLQIANLLCPGNIVVSGEKTACAALQKVAEEKGARTIALSVAGAFHTPIMKPADERLAEALAAVTIKPPRIPVWSNVDARPHTDPGEIRDLLVRQVLQPVLWEETLRGLLAEGIEVYHEVGPGRVLAGLMKRVHRKADFRNVTV